MMRQGWCLIAVCLAVVMLTLGCGRKESGQVGEGGKRVLRWSIPMEHREQDPQRMTWMHDIRLADCIFETLLKIELPGLTIGPGTAESWTVSDDGKTYTFTLREDAGWSNGDPVRPEDYRYAWRRILMPDTAGEYAKLFFDIQGAQAFYNRRNEALRAFVTANPSGNAQEARRLYEEALRDFDQNVGIRVTGPRTLEVTLVRPVPYFNELVAFTPFSPNHEQSLEAASSFDDRTGMRRVDPTYWTDVNRLITNGPYTPTKIEFRVGTEMGINPHYWNRANIANGGAHERIIDTSAALVAHRNGELDWLPELPSIGQTAADLRTSGRSDVHMEPWAGTYFYNFNCNPTLPDGRTNPLADPRVRQALTMAIDRNTIVSQATRMNQPTQRTFVPVGAIPGYEPPVEAGYGMDIAKAKSLLAEAGYPEGRGLTGLTILYNSGMGHELVAQAVKRMWETNLGVVVGLEGLDITQFGQRLRSQQFSISRASWIGDYRDPATFLDKHLSHSQSNDCGWKNAEYDALVAQAKEQTTLEDRYRLMREAEAIFLRDAPIMPIYQQTNLQVYDASKVRNVHPNPWNFRRIELIEVE